MAFLFHYMDMIWDRELLAHGNRPDEVVDAIQPDWKNLFLTQKI